MIIAMIIRPIKIGANISIRKIMTAIITINVIYYTIIWKIIFLIPEEHFSDTMMLKDEEKFRMQ